MSRNTLGPRLSELAGCSPRQTVFRQPLAKDFLPQLQAYLQHCLGSGYQIQAGPEPGFHHQAEALIAGPLELLLQTQPQALSELESLLALWHGQQQAWQKSLELRRTITASRQLRAQGLQSMLPNLVEARRRLEQGYSECDELASLLDQLERHGIPPESLKALESEYIEVLIELSHLQSELDPHWLMIA